MPPLQKSFFQRAIKVSSIATKHFALDEFFQFTKEVSSSANEESTSEVYLIGLVQLSSFF